MSKDSRCFSASRFLTAMGTTAPVSRTTVLSRLCLFASVVPPFINDGAYVKSAWGGRQSMARAISITSYEATGK